MIIRFGNEIVVAYVDDVRVVENGRNIEKYGTRRCMKTSKAVIGKQMAQRCEV